MVPGDAGWCGDRAGAADGGATGALGDGPAQTPQNPRVLPVHWRQPPSYGEVRRRILEGDDARGAQGAGGAVPGAAQRLLRHQGAALPGAQPDDARLRGRRGRPRPQAARGLRDAQPGPGDGGERGARAHGHGVLLQGRALQRRPPDGARGAALRGGGGGGGDAGRRVPRLTPGWPKDAAFSVLTMLGAISPGSRETVALVVVTIFCAQTAVSVRSPYHQHSQQ